MELKTIGNQEWCAFKDLNIPAIRARIDSGAKTSSIQATDIKLINKNDEEWVSFVVHPLKGEQELIVHCEAKLVDKRSVRSSIGTSEDRYIISTPITIGDDTFEIELSLANRDIMTFKMLLGRNAMIDRYLINPSERHLQRKIFKKELRNIYKSYFE